MQADGRERHAFTAADRKRIDAWILDQVINMLETHISHTNQQQKIHDYLFLWKSKEKFVPFAANFAIRVARQGGRSVELVHVFWGG